MANINLNKKKNNNNLIFFMICSFLLSFFAGYYFMKNESKNNKPVKTVMKDKWTDKEKEGIRLGADIISVLSFNQFMNDFKISKKPDFKITIKITKIHRQSNVFIFEEISQFNEEHEYYHKLMLHNPSLIKKTGIHQISIDDIKDIKKEEYTLCKTCDLYHFLKSKKHHEIYNFNDYSSYKTNLEYRFYDDYLDYDFFLNHYLKDRFKNTSEIFQHKKIEKIYDDLKYDLNKLHFLLLESRLNSELRKLTYVPVYLKSVDSTNKNTLVFSNQLNKKHPNYCEAKVEFGFENLVKLNENEEKEEINLILKNKNKPYYLNTLNIKNFDDLDCKKQWGIITFDDFITLRAMK